MIEYRLDAGVARITLNRPEKRNALGPDLIAAIREALGKTARDENVRVVLLAGAGPDFCSGADLGALDQTADAGVLDHLASARQLAELFLEMRHHRRPIVAAVRGRALAGGCGLATACDLVLASESAQFGYPEVKIGFVPAMVMAILRRSVSEKRAFELIATGEIISAAQAHAVGMINRVYPDAEVDARVEDYVRALAAKSASAVSLGKNLLYHMDGMTFEAAIEAGIHGNALARMTEDARRGIERFVKKS
ncbi:MAG TPA: enoyl-CoA hydratase-related protein [Bryobacteraceae bacterium]|nr:enoyl-CoA hydratase-related protein [Bryobacteraceae bacterium]